MESSITAAPIDGLALVAWRHRCATKRLMVSPVQLGGILEGVSGSDDLLAELTRREQEVAALACQGLSNADIAERLVVSVRTVESHLYSAYGKLGVSDRAGLPAVLGSQ